MLKPQDIAASRREFNPAAKTGQNLPGLFGHVQAGIRLHYSLQIKWGGIQRNHVSSASGSWKATTSGSYHKNATICRAYCAAWWLLGTASFEAANTRPIQNYIHAHNQDPPRWRQVRPDTRANFCSDCSGVPQAWTGLGSPFCRCPGYSLLLLRALLRELLVLLLYVRQRHLPKVPRVEVLLLVVRLVHNGGEDVVDQAVQRGV